MVPARRRAFRHAASAALRRLEQAFALEAERFVITEGSRPPDWRSATVREAVPALAPLEAALRHNLALLKGYAADGDQVADIASALIAGKRSQLAALRDKLATALFGQGLAGAGACALHVSGTGGNASLKNELLGAAGAPGPELSFCAGVCWVGVEVSLAGLAGVVNIPRFCRRIFTHIAVVRRAIHSHTGIAPNCAATPKETVANRE
jgi:hypothetical protein